MQPFQGSFHNSLLATWYSLKILTSATVTQQRRTTRTSLLKLLLNISYLTYYVYLIY